MGRSFRCAFVAVLVVSAVSPAVAKVTPHDLFSDNMVLQRNAEVAVWGAADPGEAVTVTLGGQVVRDTADTEGRWKVTLRTAEAGGPVELIIAGTNTITLKNVMIGEVWLCSGQSNMNWRLAAAKDAKAEIEAANHPNIRLFTVRSKAAPEPYAKAPGKWLVCDPKSARWFSAVGYFFGRDLHAAIKAPVGLIHSSWGGTAAELWTSREGLESDESLKPLLKVKAERLARYEAARAAYPEKVAAWEKAVAEAKAAGKKPPRKPRIPLSGLYPTALYNGMIHPLIQFRIAGAIWYQGESNARGVAGAKQYATLFPTMICDWRAKWGAEFPFLFVQLANYRARRPQPGDSAWARLREAQLKTLAVPRTGMAVIIDIGETGNIHPKNKQDVGKRLALAARAVAYGEKDLVCSGPIYESMKVEDGAIRLTFTHVGGGLVAKGDHLVGFAVAGEDRKFVWADARIDGDTVVVSSPSVAKPVAVRYAWADNPDCNLYNQEDLPASPFRTDDW